MKKLEIHETENIATISSVIEGKSQVVQEGENGKTHTELFNSRKINHMKVIKIKERNSKINTVDDNDKIDMQIVTADTV